MQRSEGRCEPKASAQRVLGDGQKRASRTTRLKERSTQDRASRSLGGLPKARGARREWQARLPTWRAYGDCGGQDERLCIYRFYEPSCSRQHPEIDESEPGASDKTYRCIRAKKGAGAQERSAPPGRIWGRPDMGYSISITDPDSGTIATLEVLQQ